MKKNVKKLKSFFLASAAIIWTVFIAHTASGQVNDVLKKYQTKPVNQTLINSYWDAYKKIDVDYKCEKKAKTDEVQSVNSITFDSLLRPALSNIFIGSNDLTTNTTAASFTQDDKAGTLNLNYAYLKNKKVFNIGAFSKSTDGIFGIYTNNSWSSEVGLTLGYSFPIHAGLYFDTDDCEELKNKRRAKVITVLEQYSELTKYDTVSLKADSTSLAKELGEIASLQQPPTDYSKKIDQLHLIDSVLNLYRSILLKVEAQSDALKKNKLLTDQINTIVSEWEIKKANIFTGYNIAWVSVAGAISNNTISLNTDSLPSLQKKEYKPKSLAKFMAGISINWQVNAQKFLSYLNIGANVGLHNYLDHPSVSKPGLRFDTLNKVYNVYNKNEDMLAKYEDLKANIFTIEPSFNYSIFFSASKQFGWNLRTDFRIPFNTPKETKEIYPTTFNFVTGPLFRLNKDKSLSSGTIGLDMGFVDCPINTNAWEYFAFKFKVGIPFNALIK